MVGKIGVEGDAVALVQLVAGAVDDQHQGAGEDDRRLAAARLVHRRVVAPTGRRAGVQRVQGDIGALPRQRRRQLLEAVTAALQGTPITGAADRHVLAFVQSQELRERQFQPGGDLRRNSQSRDLSPPARPARASAH